MQTIAITGANGFVGYYLIGLLLNNGYNVIATGKGACRLPYRHDRFRYVSFDFTDGETVKKFFRENKIDAVVHSGAVSKPDFCEQNRENAFKTNVTGTINLKKSAEAQQSFFVFLSTDFVFSGLKAGIDVEGKSGFYTEDDERSPVNYYGETKVMAEDEVMQYPFDWCIIRTATVFGKTFSGRDNIVTNVAGAVKEGKPLKIFNDQVRTPTHVEDLSDGILKIVQQRATGIYHIAGEDVRTPYGMALEVVDTLGSDRSLITEVTADTFQQPAARPYKTCLDISRAKAELKFQPRSFTEGLQLTLAQ